MRWYEYKMEVDDLHASDDLKNKLLAMQAQKAKTDASAPESAPVKKTARKKPPIRFPRRVLEVAAAVALCGACLYAAVSFPGITLLPSGGAAGTAETAMVSDYSLDESNSAFSSSKMAVQASGTMAMNDSRAGGSSSALSADTARESVSGSKLIYTANLTLESKDFDAARDALSDALSAAGGYMESSDESSYSGTGRSLSLTVRVPQENYTSFLDAAAQAGNLIDKSEQVQDVTTQYMDIEARLANLEAQRTRLQELQASADNLSDLLEIESSLNDVQYQIESWQSQLDWYSQQVECCTVYLSLDEVKEYTPTEDSFPARLAEALRGGWAGFVAGAQALAVWLVSIWPVLVILALAALVFWFVRRRSRR